MSRPVVLIPACTKMIGDYAFDAVGRQYSTAVAEVAECQPLLVPVGPGLADIASLLEAADAILLSGSPSNVEPHHYGEEPPLKPEALDPFRDALTLPIDNFTELPEALAPHRESLRDATVVSFCTGGIRCEKAALWMQGEGMANVLQLDGGILGYFERVGGFGYEGRCFVFDERVALDPQLFPLQDAAAA